jgi:sulfur relay (sulfurtransferase) DsrC/TusE family protein
LSKFHNRYSDEELIQILKDTYEELGRVPYIRDFATRKPNSSTFRRFGTWEDALAKAGLTKEKQKSSDYTKDELINLLNKYYVEFNKVPTTRDLKHSKGYPSDKPFRTLFGSFKQALIESGLFDLRKDKNKKIFDRISYSDDELLKYLQLYIDKNGKLPIGNEIDSSTDLPSRSDYITHFGEINNAFRLLGYDLDKIKENENVILRETMISKYKELKEILGKVPSSRDIENYSRNNNDGFSMSSYEFHFGNLYNLQVLCEFTPTVIGRNKTKNDLLDDLKRISKEIGRTPIQNDMKFFEFAASVSKYIDEFGSWNDAVISAGLTPNVTSAIYYSEKGTKCLSYYELVFANMLEKYEIEFLKEEPYKKYMETNKRYKFDYVLKLNDKIMFIEIFGIEHKKDYKERTKNKIRMCKENNLNLMEIYPKDFISYKLEEIHKMFLSKLNIQTIHNSI